MKRIYKYPTGTEVPEGAIYLYTRIENVMRYNANQVLTNYELVWHYFLVEVKE